MKKLFTALAVTVILSGCAIAPKFDNIEYNHFVELASWTQRAKPWCGEPLAMVQISEELLHRARTADIYASNRPTHDDIKAITVLVRANLEELNKAYLKSGQTPSQAYCIGKLTIVETSLKRVLPIVGDLPE